MNDENNVRQRSLVGSKLWRQERLRSLAAEAKEIDAKSGLPSHGANKRFAQRLGIAPTALSNMVHGIKPIGDEAARNIEIKLGLDAGSLDAPPFCIRFATQQELLAAQAAIAGAKAE